ncbi:hypothetical protein G9F71_020255 [Clostridium sp. FP2]|uniref:lipopolysaccharide biosynthesis protein n=1 Tax=Clostridium sp. FP2 TaxID=2724481 RepID=UPI0013E91014|nr:hypothetical protein [Clostridium sp. FP2]MBZ9625178.1 hypothetical protein [Clostridium sp. FP2]
MENRTSNSMKNILTGIILQFTTILLSLISRKIFLDNLGIEILGVNGVISNLVSMLALAELGIGTAISYSLYKPLAENDHEQINAIMTLYSKLYKYIAMIVMILGLMMLPFLKYFIHTNFTISFIKLIYFIFLIDTVMSYFLAYRRTILSADQKNYIADRITIIFSIALTIFQITVILLTKNYIFFILIKLFMGIGQNLIIYILTNKKYDYLKNQFKIELNPDIKKNIIKNVKALFLANISVYIIFGTDSILLSIFSGISIVGLYSNYTLIINAIKSIISKIFLGTTASYGNLLVCGNYKDKNDIFNILYFINFWISTFSSVSLIVLINPFIEIWLGKSMVLPVAVVYIIVFTFYSDSMRSSIELVKGAAGLYSPYPFFKYWIVMEAIVNLITSIVLAKTMGLGMYGVFLGTAISTMIPTYVMPWNVYKYVLKKSSKTYYFKSVLYSLISFGLIVTTYYIGGLINYTNIYISFILKVFLCILIPNAFIFVMFHNTYEFKYMLKKILKKN